MATSVSNALAEGLTLMRNPKAIREASRNGGVTVWDGPVVTHLHNPLRRVLFSPKRNANPFFHLFESLWMLAGRNDLPWVAQFNKQMKAYSNDGGTTQPAAYGHRWRHHFGYDQLEAIVEELARSPGTRRAVLGMWDAWGIHTYGDVHHFGDLQAVANGSADVPCNTECFFTARDGKLYMSVQCRSNDLLWGAHGANAVHFTILLEYVAAKVGLEVGEMFQYSWNYHLYDGILKYPLEEVAEDLFMTDYYAGGRAASTGETPLFLSAEDAAVFDRDLPAFMDWLDPATPGAGSRPYFEHGFLRATAAPMFEAWAAYKSGDFALALTFCDEIEGQDWGLACKQWVQRRVAAKEAKK
jgi:hypothetical protein